MNEQAIIDSYNLAVQNGYKKSIDEFKSLLSTNSNALNDIYGLAVKNGYSKSIDDYKVLMGVTKPVAAVQEEAVVQQPKKKEDTTALPSGLGSSASSVSTPDPEATRFGKLASSLEDKFKTQVPESYGTSNQFQKDLVEAPIRKAKEDKELAQAQLSASNEFDKLGEKPKIEQSKYLNQQLTQINKDLIGKTEEFVVPEMEYRFGNLGFKFEEAERGRDYMNVTAPNGKTTQISLDNFLESTSASEALKLQKFVQDNTPVKGLFVLEKTLREQDKTFNSQKEVDDEAARINQEATAVNQKQKDFLLRKDAFEKEVEALNLTPESQWNTPEFINKVNELEKKRIALSNEMPTLISEEEALTKKASALDRSVGKYVSAKAKQGTWYGGVGNSILNGFGSILADAQGRFIDISTEILPTGLGMGEDFGRQIAVTKADKIGAAPPEVGQSMDDWKASLTEKQLDAWEDEVDDAKKKFLKKDLQPAAREGLRDLTASYIVDTNTTPEWEKLTKEGFWGGAILGLAQSLPAMIGRGNPMGWVQRTSQMYAQVSDGLMQEMENDPAFANISESEKAAIIAPIGVVSSVLEAYGLRNVLQSKGIVTSITMAALGKAGQGVGNKSFRELVENEVTSRIAKGAIVITAAGLAEAETGAAQEISETGFKAVYNMIKGEDLFKNPQTIQAFVKDVAIAGAQEAVGGFILGVPNAVGAAYSKKGFLKMDDKTFEAFENMANDGSLQSAYIISLKEKIASGKISPSDAKEELQNYRTAVGVYRQLPDGLNVQQKKEAMNLLKERKDLEQYIEGKDNALVTPQKNRINEINQELSKIAEQGAAQKVESETNDAAAKRAAKMAELSKAIEDDDTATELNLSTKLPTEERQRIEKELQDLKEEQASVQEQETATPPVATETKVEEVVKSGLTPEQRRQQIESIELGLKLDDRMLRDGGQSYNTDERRLLEEELQTLKAEEDAFQKQAAGQVPVQSGATVSQEVAQGEPQAEPQVTSEAGVQEEVTPTTELTDEQIVEYNPTEEVADKNNEVLGKVLQSKKVVPQAEPQITDFGDSVMFEFNNMDDDGRVDKPNTWTRLTFKKKKDGTITGVGVKVERNAGNIRNTDFFRNYVNSKRTEAAAQPEVTAQPKPLTQEEQLAKMEELFTQEEVPAVEPARTSGVSVADPIGMDSLRKRVQDNAKKQVVDFAQKTLTTLKSVLPDFEIVVHDDENSYRNAMASVNGPAESAGYFSYVQRPDGTYVGKIDINLNGANKATVAHEVAHGIMRKTFGENTEAFRTLKNRIASVLNREGNQALTDFASQYEENDSYEEYLVELAAQLTQAEKNLSPTLLQNIASIINEVVSKITNGAFTPFQNVRDTKQTIEFLRNISESIKKGEAINPADITAIQENLSAPIGTPSEINPAPKGKASLSFPKNPLPLSFVTEADKIDINALIDDIVVKKQKVWFWMADQLGRGYYFDEVVGDTHYLDAGPSFALDPANRSKGILWASGLPEKTLTNQINQADYIFFISGSPEKAKLFNKRVLDLLAERINKTSDFNKFREAINNFEKETVELRTIKDALNGVNSFKELADSPKRKPFLIAIGEIGSLKTAPKGSLKELLGSFNAFIDYNELRDGFYKENGFGQNDIMLVGKPTGVSGKAPHSTYEFAISGEVVGVPDKKIDSWDIMPESIKEKYKDVIGGREEKTKPMQTKVIAAETGVIRELEPRMKGKAQLNTDAKAIKVVQQARAQGFSEDVIKQFLESKGLSPETIKKAMAKETPASKTITLSEETLKGYDSLMKKLENLAAKGMPLAEVISKLKNSKTYRGSTDVQKEKLVREVRKMFGVRQKSAPTVKRILGQLKDITKITMTETQVLNKRIKELAEGAKLAKKSISEANKFLAEEIKEMASKGKITSKQATSLTVRALKFNPLSEASISNFVDYVAKVLSKAEYVDKMTTALKQISQAKKNIKTKIGVAEDLFVPLNTLLSINPTLIPLNQLEKYLKILKDFGARKAVLSIPERVNALKQVNEILDEINNERSQVDVLADRFNNYEEKVIKDDALDYAATINSMVDKGLISTSEAELMKKYKSEILPQVEATPLTDEEIAEQKKEEIEILKNLKVGDKEFDLPSRDEKEDAKSLAKLIKELSVDDLMNLSLTDLKNIIKVIDNINNGYLPHYAKVSLEKLEAIKQGKVLSSAIERANPLSFSKLYSRLKSKFTKKEAIEELIRANPKYYIDNVFGDFKTRDIFNSLLEKSAQALAVFNSELKRVEQKIEAAQNKVLASFKQNPDKYLMSKFRMTTYMLQREYESNIGKKGVRPVTDYLKETIKHIRTGRSIYKEADALKLEQILKEVERYTVDGKVDLDKFYNTFNSAEKNAIDVTTEINKSLGEKAAYTASVIRGGKVELMDNYFHHNVLHEQNPMDATSAPEFSNSYSKSMKPSTKAKSLIERTGELTPLNFDLFASTYKGAKFVLLDYNLTSPIRTARRTLIQAKKNLEAKGLMNKERVQIFNAIDNSYEEALENILTNAIVQDALANEVVDFIQKQGYRAALAGTVRFKAELASNIANALLINPLAFKEGIKHAKLIASANGYEFMKNAKSKQLSRLYASDALSGKMVDPQILKQTSGIKGSVSKSALMNRTIQFYNLTLKKYVQNPVEYISDTMLTTPDKIVSMPLWFGSFMNEFKRITGEEVNQEMMVNNDSDYMNKYADAIEQATRKADQESVYSGASNNEFMGILKGKLKPNQGFKAKVWNNFNSYMTNFMNFDYAAARSAVYNLFNEGYMTKQKAAAVLAGITTRSVIYQVMVANMGAGIVGAGLGLAFDWEDEEEVDEKSYLQMLGRGLANVLVGYTVGRNFGNAVRGMINFGVEKINEEYLDFLRNGEYDFYKDNIAYTYVNVGDRGDIDIAKMAVNMAGPYTPALNTAVLIGKNFDALSSRVMGKGPTKKEPEAIRRERMITDYRIPLELAGNAGFIPFYKDVKKAVNDEIYKDLRKASNTPDSSIPEAGEYDELKDLRELKAKTRNEEELKAINKKILEITGSEEAKEAIQKQKEALTEKKKRLLYDSSKGQRYNNESDMKRLNPSLWRKRFGPNSDWNKETKAKETVERKLGKVEEKREDKEYRQKNRR